MSDSGLCVLSEQWSQGSSPSSPDSRTRGPSNCTIAHPDTPAGGGGCKGEGVGWELCGKGETITERNEDTHCQIRKDASKYNYGGRGTGEECSLLSKGSLEPDLSTLLILMIL